MMTRMFVVALVIIGGYFVVKNTQSNDDLKQQSVQKAVVETVQTQDQAVKMSENAQSEPVATGSYETYDPSKITKAKDGKIVLFFRASWCPSCKALDKDIRDHLNAIPGNVTILDVDYDKYADLKKKYGIVTQHTLVQVDESGNELQKWVGVPTLSDLVNELS